jgi:hypothetical protein
MTLSSQKICSVIVPSGKSFRQSRWRDNQRETRQPISEALHLAYLSALQALRRKIFPSTEIFPYDILMQFFKKLLLAHGNICNLALAMFSKSLWVQL